MNGFKSGEAKAAADVLRDRLDAAAGGEVFVAEVNVNTGAMRGEDFAFRSVYGDLFDVAEVAHVAEAPVMAFFMDIAGGVDPTIALRSMYLLAAAHGVLIERARDAS